MSILYRCIRSVVCVVIRFMFRIKVVGKENIPKDGAFLLCSNHTSMLDIPLLVALFPRQINFMAKKELFSFPPLKWLFSAMGAFPVDRGGRDIGAIRHSCAIIKNGDVLGVFPEGTRYRDCLPPREVKSGSSFIALKTGADVLPVAIYKEKGTHPLRRVTVRIGEVIKSSDLCEGKPTKENISLVSSKLHKAITELWELKF